MKAYAYLRVSSKGQVEGDGLTRQMKAIEDYVKANGIEVVDTFSDEGISGTMENRPALAELLVALEDDTGNGVKTVLIERMDRLARDLLVQETIAHDMQKMGVRLISVCDGEDLLSEEPTRRLVRQVLGAIAEYDKTVMVLKLRVARERIRAKTGKCEGRKGYNEISPGVLEELRKLRLVKPRLTRRDMAACLNEKGLKSCGGDPFSETTVRNLLHRYGR